MAKLSEYFEGVAVKRLSTVEADTAKSNQHELNGIQSLKKILGTAKRELYSDIIYLGKYDDEVFSDTASLTWYDSRENVDHRSPEFRLYFTSNEVMEKASPGDMIVIAKKPDDSVLLLVIHAGSTFVGQVLWLFGLTESLKGFNTETIEGERNRKLGFVERTILEAIGVETEIEEPVWLERILGRFGGSFPKTVIFSAFARETSPRVSSLEDPDAALLTWIDHEEMLFRTLERHIVEQKLNQGFSNDVDAFIKYSLSVLNRRKSRMGHALEHHLNYIFENHQLSFSKQVITEQGSRPDYLFPGIDQYCDQAFPSSLLTMLGVKSTCKERWNQVLAEANRIDSKHLLTLEPGISLKQTSKMQEKLLQLVLPKSLHETYIPEQRDWLMNLGQFIELVRDRENSI